MAVYGGFAGVESVRSARASHTSLTVIQAGGNVVTFPVNAAPGTLLDTFTVRGGSTGVVLNNGAPLLANVRVAQNGTGITGATEGLISRCVVEENSGDGIRVSGAVRIEDGVVSNNNNSGIFINSGAAIVTGNQLENNRNYAIRADGAPLEISGNTVDNTGGGGAEGFGAIHCELDAGAATIIARNIVTDSGCAGISVTRGAARIRNNTLKGNKAARGGAVYLREGAPVVVGNVMATNTSLQEGGAVFLRDTTSAKVYNNTIVANTSGGVGGALYLMNGAAELVNNIIAYNAPGVFRAGGTLNIRYNLFYGNLLYDGAGGVYFSGVAPQLLMNTITGNQASVGAGVYAVDTNGTIIANNIIADNTSGWLAGESLPFAVGPTRDNVRDAFRIVGGLSGATPSDVQKYDVNGDGRVDMVDLVRLTRAAAGL